MLPFSLNVLLYTEHHSFKVQRNITAAGETVTIVVAEIITLLVITEKAERDKYTILLF